MTAADVVDAIVRRLPWYRAAHIEERHAETKRVLEEAQSVKRAVDALIEMGAVEEALGRRRGAP